MSEELRYPVGRFIWDGRATREDIAGCIRELEEAPARLRAAVNGLDDRQLDTPYRPGGWTVRQVVHHLADSHLAAYSRVRFALTEARPLIKTYDQNAWAALPDAARLDPGPSLALLEGLHARWVALLRLLPEHDFSRAFLHPESGEWTVDKAVACYAWHGRHHTAQISSLRARQGW